MENPETSALDAVRARIEKACRIARRQSDEVQLIAVSKTHPAEAIEPLLAKGHRLFGESRVGEAQEKWSRLREQWDGVELHLVGRLQSNKALEAAKLFDCIHSLDRPSLIGALGRAFDRTGRALPCFIQVNVGREPQKGGCAIEQLDEMLEEARAAQIPIAGLMAIPPAEREPAPYFALLARLAKERALAALNMGMSSDFETAIQLGATHVRVGNALFGDRAAPARQG